MRLTPTQRLLAGVALRIKPGEQLGGLVALSSLPAGVQSDIASPIEFLTKLRQHCGTVQDFIAKLREMLNASCSFSDLRTLVEGLYPDCRDDDLRSKPAYPMGMAVYTPSEKQKSDFSSTLLKMSESIPTSIFEIMVTVTPIPDAKKEHIRRGFKLFNEMQQCGYISENDTDFLEDLLEELNLSKTLELLEKYKRDHPPVECESFTPQRPVRKPTQASSNSFSSLPAYPSPRPSPGGGSRYGSLPEEPGSSQRPSALVGGNGYKRSGPGSLPSGSFGSLPSDVGSLPSGSYHSMSGGGGSGPPGLAQSGLGRLNSIPEGGGLSMENISPSIAVPPNCLQRHLQKFKSLPYSVLSPSPGTPNGAVMSIPHDNTYPGPPVYVLAAATPPGSHDVRGVEPRTATKGDVSCDPDPEPSAPPPPYNPHMVASHQPPLPPPLPRREGQREWQPQHGELHAAHHRREGLSMYHHEQAAEVPGDPPSMGGGESTLPSGVGATPSTGASALSSLESYSSPNMQNGPPHRLSNAQVGNGPKEPQAQQDTGPQRYVHGNYSGRQPPPQPAVNMRHFQQPAANITSQQMSGGIPSSQTHSEPSSVSYERPSEEVFQPSLQSVENNRGRKTGLHQQQAAPARFYQNVEGSFTPLSLERQRTGEMVVLPPDIAPVHEGNSRQAVSAVREAYDQNQAGNGENQYREVLHQRGTKPSPALTRKQAVQIAKETREDFHSMNEPVVIPVTASPPNSAHRNQPRAEGEENSNKRSLSGQELAQCSDTQASLYPTLPSSTSYSSEDERHRVTRSKRKRSKASSVDVPPKRSKTEPIAPREPKKKSGVVEKIKSWWSGKKEISDSEEQKVTSANREDHDEEEYHSCEEGEGEGEISD